MLRFSANLSLLFADQPWAERCRLAAACGFRGVEIQFPYELPAAQWQTLLAAHDLRLVLFNVAADTLLAGGEGLAAVPERRHDFQAALDQALAYVQILRPQAVNVLPGRCLDPSRRDAYLDTFRANLRTAVAAFAAIGVRTVFEAINSRDMPGFLIDSGQGMLDMLAAVAHPMLGLQYDVYHMAMMGEDYRDFLARHISRIFHIQFADCPGRGQPGTGNIDFSTLFAQIAGLDYAGWVGAEYRPQGDTAASLGWLGGAR